MKTEQEIKSQMIIELMEIYKDENISLCEITSAVNNMYSTCGCCYSFRYTSCSNLKSTNLNKPVNCTDTCSEFLHFDAFE